MRMSIKAYSKKTPCTEYEKRRKNSIQGYNPTLEQIDRQTDRQTDAERPGKQNKLISPPYVFYALKNTQAERDLFIEYLRRHIHNVSRDNTEIVFNTPLLTMPGLQAHLDYKRS